MALLQPEEIAQPQNQLTLQGVASLARHAELAIHSAEVGVSDCMVGPQPGGGAVALGCARGIALREKRGAEVAARFSEIGLEPDSAAVGGDRLWTRPAVLVDLAPSAVGKPRLAARLGL